MARRRRPLITYTNCKRCGKPLATASRSIMGLDKLKERLGSICSDCITPEEEQEMLNAMASAILKK